jgi:hypothetical protein
MNTSRNTNPVSKSMQSISNFNVGGISLVEMAVLGAAGFVVWKNREKIKDLLESSGLNVPSFLSSDLTDLIQSGVSIVSGKELIKNSSSSMKSMKHDA